MCHTVIEAGFFPNRDHCANRFIQAETESIAANMNADIIRIRIQHKDGFETDSFSSGLFFIENSFLNNIAAPFDFITFSTLLKRCKRPDIFPRKAGLVIGEFYCTCFFVHVNGDLRRVFISAVICILKKFLYKASSVGARLKNQVNIAPISIIPKRLFDKKSYIPKVAKII